MENLKEKIRPKAIYFRWFAATILILWAAILWQVITQESDRKLTVAFLDVGQGDAIFIESPTGRQALIDAGPNRAVLRRLGEILPFYDHSVDLVISSHDDSDHVGGLPEVLSRYRAIGWLMATSSSLSSFSQAAKILADQEKVYLNGPQPGMKIDLGGGAMMTMLAPRSTEEDSDNERSIVIRLDYGESSFLFAGDLARRTENELAARLPGWVDVDVFKVSHHGSRNSGSEAFYRQVSPDYSVISVGAGNRYGHPHKETLELFERLGVKILRTDQDGTIVFESDGKRLNLTQPVFKQPLP